MRDWQVNLEGLLPATITQGSLGSGMAFRSHQANVWASLVAQMVKDLPAMWETWVQSLGWVGKIPWRMAWQPSSVFWPGESPWTQEPGGLQSMRPQSWTRLSDTAQANVGHLEILSL